MEPIMAQGCPRHAPPASQPWFDFRRPPRQLQHMVRGFSKHGRKQGEPRARLLFRALPPARIAPDPGGTTRG
jgi:hypothetical protein